MKALTVGAGLLIHIAILYLTSSVNVFRRGIASSKIRIVGYGSAIKPRTKSGSTLLDDIRK
jgi:hypothetical protein